MIAKHWIATAGHCVPLINQKPSYDVHDKDGVKDHLEVKRGIGSTNTDWYYADYRPDKKNEVGPTYDVVMTHEKFKVGTKWNPKQPDSATITLQYGVGPI